jgi:hypothetical protein
MRHLPPRFPLKLTLAGGAWIAADRQRKPAPQTAAKKSDWPSFAAGRYDIQFGTNPAGYKARWLDMWLILNRSKVPSVALSWRTHGINPLIRIIHELRG